MVYHNIVDRLSFRLVAAGALMLLALLPLAWQGNESPVHPVSAYGKMRAPATPSHPSGSR